MILGLLLMAAVDQSAPAAAPTAQQAFDAASAAYDRGDYADAVTQFDAAEARLGSGAKRSRAIAEGRKGQALAALGRDAEALVALRNGVAGMPATDTSLRPDRLLSLLSLGRLEELELDYAAARRDFADALSVADSPADRAEARGAMARTTMFDDPALALTQVDAALADLAAAPDTSKAYLAQMTNLKGRVLLNAGRPAEARSAIDQSIKGLGGLTMKVDRSDIAARSDMAIASLLSGAAADAKKYLAYSASGTLEGGFALGADMSPPACGFDGLAPGDVAVIEFSIAEDGHVTGVRPVYSSAHGDKALLFARAVADWSWTPEQAAKIKPFFRAMSRVELRCSTAPENAPTMRLIQAGVTAWLGEHQVEPFVLDTGSDALAVPLLRAELARREAKYGPDSLELVPVLRQLIDNKVTANSECAAWAQRILQIMTVRKAPVAVRTSAELEAKMFAPEKRGRANWMAWLNELVVRPDVAADVDAKAEVQLFLADMYLGNGDRRRALPALEAIVSAKGLADHDPIRIAALVRAASLRAAEGDVEVARDLYLQTGLTSQQCSLVDARPVRVQGKGSESDYPKEAVEWGISGWAVVQFDINADGSVAAPRAIAAYPPFVFGKPTEKIVGRSRYTQTYRPDGSHGCTGSKTVQRFNVVY